MKPDEKNQPQHETKYRLVYCTTSGLAEAEEIGRKLVEERRVACANLIPQMISIYEWEGKLEQASEAILLLKTTEDQISSLIPRIVELHSYETPAILTIPVESGSAEFLKWISDQVNPG